MARRQRRETAQPFLVITEQLRPWSTRLPGVARLARKGVGSLWGLTRVRAVLLAEDLLLLLLLTDDIRGRFSTSGKLVDIMLEGATLVELALMGRVEISREVKPIRFLGTLWDERKVDRLVVGDSSPTGDAVLDAALQDVIAWEGEFSVMRKGGQRFPSLTETLRMRLLSGGVISPREATRSVAGSQFRYDVEVRRRVIQALVEQTTPDARTAALIALLHTIKHEPQIIYRRYARWSWVIDWPGLTRYTDGAPPDAPQEAHRTWRTDRQQQLGARSFS
jgi:hypothetical protein